jgi:uncharacterized membrane protein
MFQGKIWQWRSLKRLVLVLIIICALMRFFNLGVKPYWYDEVYTSLRLSGYTKVDIFERVKTGQHTFGTLENFQCPRGDRGIEDVFNGLITDDVHPPLYFFLLYYWIKVFACTVEQLRLFSALLSLLLIPASYALICEIFGSKTIALLSTLLVINSPIFIIYAQEARQYILLVVLALFSSISLLRYFSNSSPKNLIMYGLLSTAGLYCHTLYYGVMIGQVGYWLFCPNEFHQNRSLFKNIIYKVRANRSFIFTLFLSFLLFLMWLFRVIYLKGFQISIGADYTWKEFSSEILFQRIILNLASVINDFESPIKSQILTQNLVNLSLLDLNFKEIFTIIFIPLIILYSLWYTIKHSDRSRVSLLGWLALPSVLFLSKDLLFGGSSASIIRYQLLSVFGLYAALSFCLVHLFKTTAFRWIKGIILVLVLILCQMQIYSNFNYLKSSTWWSKYGDYKLQEFAHQVNQSAHPIILGEANYREMVNLLKLSYILNPSVPFELVDKENFSEISLNSYDVFWVPQV